MRRRTAPLTQLTRLLPIGRSSTRLLAVLLLALAGVVLTAAPASASPRHLPALTPAANDGLTRALHAGRLTKAEYALERVRALRNPSRARQLFGDVDQVDGRAATQLLRDLAARMNGLSPSKRTLAERLLARPTSSRDPFRKYRYPAKHTCERRMCFFWVTRGADAPSLRDGNRNHVPDWVDSTRKIFAHVWSTEIGSYGYRAPRSDITSRNHGPNKKLDIYIADLGSMGLYGYCTSDDPATSRRTYASAYCVVDDDFSRRQFRSGAYGLNAMKVTAAHEFFHAVQYGYDWLEDTWLMEGSAAWIEDEVYDSINDNIQYLSRSPISATRFWHPLDYYNPNNSSADSLFKYGAWIYFRFMSERYGRPVMKAVWRRADSIPGAPDDYSIKAVSNVLATHGVTLADFFADFGATNLLPAIPGAYQEGGSYPTIVPSATQLVGPGGLPRSPGIGMPHLSNDYYSFVPSGVSTSSILTLDVELPGPETSPRAQAVVQGSDGSVSRLPAVQDVVPGHWKIIVPNFGLASRVTLVLTNGSARYTCWQRKIYSCQGTPLDDNVSDFYTATIS